MSVGVVGPLPRARGTRAVDAEGSRGDNGAVVVHNIPRKGDNYHIYRLR